MPTKEDGGELGEPRNLTTEDVRAYFGFENVDTIYRIPPEQLPYVKIRGRRRYRASDVRAYEQEHLVESSR